MNFVLHAHLARRDRGSDEAAAGAMLPDLWRMADRRVRARGAAVRPDDAPVALGRVLDGIEHHLEVDQWFHAAPVFLEGERRARHRLARAVPGGRRIAVFAHVAWELCLDGALIEREGLEVVLARLRAAATVVEGPAGREAERLHGVGSGSSPVAAGPFSRRVIEIARAIAAGPWVAGYTDGHGLASRLSGLRARVGIGPFDPRAHAAIATAMEELLEAARRELDAVLEARDGS